MHRLKTNPDMRIHCQVGFLFINLQLDKRVIMIYYVYDAHPASNYIHLFSAQPAPCDEQINLFSFIKSSKLFDLSIVCN